MSQISVIVPVYNTEKFLFKCIDSILNQTFSDFEIILINDGSFDSSKEICESFALKDSRIRFYDQDNKGIGFVRNKGLTLAKSKYIIHVDSDDYLEPSFLELLFNKIEKDQSDLVYCDFFRFNQDEKWIDIQYSNLEPGDIIKRILTENFFGGLWNKLIKRSVYLENNVKIYENLSMYEDLFSIIEVLKCCNKISYVNEPLYNYRENLHSISYNRNKKTFESAFFVVSKIEDLLLYKNEYKQAIIDFKLLIKRDVLLFGTKHNFKKIYPEVDQYIYKSTVLTTFQKVCLILQHYKLNNLVKFLLMLRKLVKKFSSIEIHSS